MSDLRIAFVIVISEDARTWKGEDNVGLRDEPDHVRE
jgi:hypothetical protein